MARLRAATARGIYRRQKRWLRGAMMLPAAVLCVAAVAAIAATPGPGATAFARGDYAAARQQWQSVANSDPQAQYDLGLLYANGWNVPPNPPKALHWYTMAADRDQVLAQYNLAVMRQRGDGVPQDLAEAAFWYGEAARQGLEAAIYNLALMTLAGQGLRPAPVRALAMLDAVDADDRARVIAALPAGRVAAATANLRNAPSLDADVRRRLARGAGVRVVGHHGHWTRVWLPRGHVVSWIASRLLGVPAGQRAPDFADVAHGPLTDLAMERPGAAAAGLEAPPAPRLAVAGNASLAPAGPAPMQVAAPRLNVRTRPRTTSRIRDQLHRGARVRVLESRGGWRRIRTASGTQGWVAAFLLRAP